MWEIYTHKILHTQNASLGYRFFLSRANIPCFDSIESLELLRIHQNVCYDAITATYIWPKGMIFACPLEYLTSKNSHAPWIRAVNQGLIGGCSVPKEPEDIQKLLETLVKEELISLPKIAKILAHSQDLQLQKLIVEVLV